MRAFFSEMRTIEWLSGTEQVRLIDQRRLPAHLEYLTINDARQMADAIRTMAVRGAPALGVAAAFAIALEAARNRHRNIEDLRVRLNQAAELLVQARPTAVNLSWGVGQMLALVEDPSIRAGGLVDALVAKACAMAEEDVRINYTLARNGASLIEDGDTLIHHCNTGALAVVDWGTALGAIRFAHEQGKRVHVLVDETRPLLQGSRLTAWECEQYGIPYEIITDSMAGYFLRSGKVNKVFFGADRVAANGDVVNKIGTYMLSLAAHASNVPVVCVFPLSTFDPHFAEGDQIPIEERDPQEVLGIQLNAEVVVPKGAKARNPAFDVTPHDLITHWVTEAGVIETPFAKNIAASSYNLGLGKEDVNFH